MGLLLTRNVLFVASEEMKCQATLRTDESVNSWMDDSTRHGTDGCVLGVFVYCVEKEETDFHLPF